MRSLRLPLAGLLLCAGCPSPVTAPDAAAPAEPRAVTVWVTGDVGGELAAARSDDGGRYGGAARHPAAAAGADLVVDAGDRFLPARWIPPRRRDRASWSADVHALALDRAEARALVLADRDFALGPEALAGWAARAGVRLLSANLVPTSTRAPSVAPFVVLHAADVAVGVVGVSPPTEAPGYRSTPGRVALTRAAISARGAGAEVVLALVHAPLETAEGWWSALPDGVVDGVALADEAAPSGRVWTAGGRVVGTLGSRGRGGLRWAFDVAPEGTVTATAAFVRIGADTPEDALLGRRIAAGPPKGPVDPPRYRGAKACAGECHAAAWKAWRRGPHAKAWASLRPVRQTGNPDCGGCHMTGFLRPGGTDRIAWPARLRNVSCEACHGVSAAHVAAPTRAPDRSGEGACRDCHGVKATEDYDAAAALRALDRPGHRMGEPR